MLVLPVRVPGRRGVGVRVEGEGEEYEPASGSRIEGGYCHVTNYYCNILVYIGIYGYMGVTWRGRVVLKEPLGVESPTGRW